MSGMALQVLVGTALTDTRFCEGLLYGSRCNLVADFDLTEEERQAVLGIRASSLQEFAAELCEWLELWTSHDYVSSAVTAPHPASQHSIEQFFLSDHVGCCPGNTSGS